MNDRPFVSVVMIFLDAKQFIREAVESVFAQTYENWELLLVDDGSKDGSTLTAREYAAKHPGKVRYLEHPGHANLGMSASRNLGIAHARGEFIALLDADDVWLPRKLEKQVTALREQTQAAMVYGPTMDWHSWDGVGKDAVQNLGVEAGRLHEPPRLAEAFLRDDHRSPRTCSVLIRKQALLDIGGFESGFRGMFEDQAFFQKLCLTKRVYVMGECLDKYRRHPQSCTNAAGLDEYFAKRLVFLDWLTDYLRKQNIADPGLHEAIEFSRDHARRPAGTPSARKIRQGISRCVRAVARTLIPSRCRRWLWSTIAEIPPVGTVRFGHLRRTEPISRSFGFDRGQPIDRFYVERFLKSCAEDVRGRVLEIGDPTYTRQFGGNRVTQSDVLHVTAGNPIATIVGDLTNAPHIPSDSFDCVILPQTLQLIYDVPAALRTVHRILKSGGVVLATFPGISQLSGDEWADYWCWSFTKSSARRRFEEVFPTTDIRVEGYGNVLAATSFLYGLAAQELTEEELNCHDRCYEMLIGVRARKPNAK